MKFLTVLIIFTCLLTVNGHCTQKYSIKDLGTLQSDGSTPETINDLCQIAGYYSWKGDKYTFFWDPEEGLMTLEVPKGDSFEISFLSEKHSTIWGVTRKLNNNQVILARWGRTEGYRPYNPLYLKEGSLNEIFGLTKDIFLIGSYTNQSSQKFYFRGSTDVHNLPIIYGDLGLPIVITKLVGSSHWQENQPHTIVVANCLCPVINKGEVVRYLETSIFWRSYGNQAWMPKKIIPFADNITSTKALCMNNSGQVICETEGEWSLIDLKKNTSKNIRKYGSVCSLNNKGFFLTNEMDLVEIVQAGNEIGKHHLNFGDTSIYINYNEGLWKKICSVRAINDSCYVIGEAETIFGEVHAVLLEPVKS